MEMYIPFEVIKKIDVKLRCYVNVECKQNGMVSADGQVHADASEAGG